MAVRFLHRTLSSSLILAVALFTFAGCTPAPHVRKMPVPPSVSDEHPLTIMTFNIRMGLGRADPNSDVSRMQNRWGRNLAAVIETIRSENPEVVGLQEVAGPEQLRDMARKLDMHHVFVGHDPGEGRTPWWGVGILSKYPIVSSRRTALSDTRNFIIATINTGTRKIAVANIHRNHLEFSEDFLPILMGELSQVNLPTLLLGDFNIRPNARMPKTRHKRELQPVLDRFVDTAIAARTLAARQARLTGTAQNGLRIDYIFAQRDQFKILDAGLVGTRYRDASNHYAYFASVTFKQ